MNVLHLDTPELSIKLEVMKNILSGILIMVSGMIASSAYPVSPMPLSEELIEELRATGELESVVNALKTFNQQSLLTMMPAPAAPVTSGSGVAILVDFVDNKADTLNHPPAKYDTLLFSVGKWPTGSMKDFYIENSYGLFKFTGKVAPPPAKGRKWYRLPESYTYWSENYGFSHSGELAIAAAQAADADIDFSQFDNDGPDAKPNSGDDDGYVDALYVVHAGPGYEENHCGKIWSHMSGTDFETNDNAKNGGKIRIGRYSHQPEERCDGALINMGVYAHEYGHILGLPDLYDYGYDAEGAGRWTIMASGSWNGGGATPAHFDAWSKSQLGWIEPELIKDYKVNAPIPAAEYTPKAYRLWTDGDTVPRQYFLVENRQKIGRFDKNLPGEGLLIYHVDDYKWSNDDQYIPGEGSAALHYHVAVEQADGRFDLERNSNQGDPGDAFPGTSLRKEFAGFLPYPTSRDYHEEETKVAVLSISNSDSVMTANLDVGRHLPYFKLESLSQQSPGAARIENGETGSIYITLTNSWGRGENVEAELFIDNPYITIGKATSVIGAVESGETVSNNSDPFSVTISASSPGCIKTDAEIVLRELNTGAEQSFTAEIVFGWPGVIIVNDADNDDILSMYEDVLDKIGVPYEIANSDDLDGIEEIVLNQGIRDSVVVWFTGKKSETLDDDEEGLLSALLDSGGKLIISSENLGEERSGSAFYDNYLHAEFRHAKEDEVLLAGTPGNPIVGEDEKIAVLPSYSDSKDAVFGLEGADAILQYSDGDAGALIVKNDTFQVIYLAFPFEGVGGNPSVVLSQDVLMKRFFEWFGYHIGVSEPAGPGSMKNEATLLSSIVSGSDKVLMNIAVSSDINLRFALYDASGKRISSKNLGMLQRGVHRLEITTAPLPSGVYFATLDTGNSVCKERFVLIK